MSQAGVVTMKAMVQRLNRRLERDSDCRQISFSLAFAFFGQFPLWGTRPAAISLPPGANNITSHVFQ
jgi:hypothetical protein